MHILNWKRIHRYRKQTSSYQWGKEKWKGQDGEWDYETQTTMDKTDKQQGYIVQHTQL